MRALFVHDNRFIPADGGIYSESQFPGSQWSRYLAVFDELTVLGRRGAAPDHKAPADLELSSAPGVQFIFAPDLSSLAGQIRDRRRAHGIVTECVCHADAVIARLPSELGLVAIAEARRNDRAWAVEMAGCPWDGLWNYGTWQGRAYAPIMAARVRRAVARAPFALYVTREFLQSRYPNRMGETVACSNVEIPAPDPAILQHRLNEIRRRSRTLVLGLIGTLQTRYKGIQTVLEALSRAGDRLPPVRFRVLGGGDPAPWRAEAARWNVANRVSFDGTVPAGEPVLQWLDSVDIYLQPSLQEGLPRALIEAMSRACPAIGSTCAGIPELLARECLIRPGDADDLTEKLVFAATNVEWQDKQARRNWTVAGEYSREQLERRRRDFWQRFAEYAAARRRSSA